MFCRNLLNVLYYCKMGDRLPVDLSAVAPDGLDLSAGNVSFKSSDVHTDQETDISVVNSVTQTKTVHSGIKSNSAIDSDFLGKVEQFSKQHLYAENHQNEDDSDGYSDDEYFEELNENRHKIDSKASKSDGYEYKQGR